MAGVVAWDSVLGLGMCAGGVGEGGGLVWSWMSGMLMGCVPSCDLGCVAVVRVSFLAWGRDDGEVRGCGWCVWPLGLAVVQGRYGAGMLVVHDPYWMGVGGLAGGRSHPQARS
jgi:hypothetical protein